MSFRLGSFINAAAEQMPFDADPASEKTIVLLQRAGKANKNKLCAPPPQQQSRKVVIPLTMTATTLVTMAVA